jgi:transaldolase/glucose-6-phosphate isomerase
VIASADITGATSFAENTQGWADVYKAERRATVISKSILLIAEIVADGQSRPYRSSFCPLRHLRGLRENGSMSLNSLTYSIPRQIEQAFDQEISNSNAKAARIWRKDGSVWTGNDEAKWLGWLDIVERELGDMQKYRDLAEDVAAFEHILLLGMGGSSLCPEVLAMTFVKEKFHILDSTVPAQVKAVEEKIDIARTLFIVASKSGSTLEPNCFKQYFFDKVSQTSDEPGKQFIAITDPGSKMEQVAKADGFRHIFYGDPEIGGRFSALSVFGMIPAAAMGIDVEAFLKSAAEMVEARRSPHSVSSPHESKGAASDEVTKAETESALDPGAVNPGVMLGTILGVCHKLGRDKLTIFTSPELYDVGAWLEQLIAESTGKNGIAIIPVDREQIVPADHYGNDRVFVYLGQNRDSHGAGDEDSSGLTIALHAIEQAEHPLIRITLDSVDTLGQEFFRWEFATAVAGSIMGINPFNQPDVEAAKIEARKLTDQYEKAGSLPDEKPFFEENGFALYSGDTYAEELKHLVEEPTLASFLEGHILNAEPPDYFAILAYVQMNAENEDLLQEIRVKVLEQTQAATCLGFGPRFLHSTGQAYKGGGNNGVFLQITSDDEFDLPVPGQKYTFGIVKAAQARGDFQVLLDRGRRALRVHLSKDVTVRQGLEYLLAAIS